MTRPTHPTARLVELDALRGIAATLVMLFHYTTRYDQLFGHTTPPTVHVPWGHFGVNLFFMISGFVIFMTLHRVSRPLDFLVSRFSRLFPAFWVAVALTFVLTHALEVPDKAVDFRTALLNLSMIHGLFNIRNVDGVYWTLEIEVIFYGMALLLFMVGRLDRVHMLLLILVAMRLIYFVAERYAGVQLSWTLSHLLILPYIAWFSCGIIIYRRVTFPTESPQRDFIVLGAAILQLSVTEGLGLGILAVALCSLVLAAAGNKLPILANPVLVWLGTISYTLYLLHENIGWGVIMRLQKLGVTPNISILCAIGLSLTLATALTWFVERPAMKWLRRIYRRHVQSPLSSA